MSVATGDFDPTGTYLGLEGPDGRVHQIPTRPGGKYLLVEHGTARRDAARPAAELLDEISSWARDLHNLDHDGDGVACESE